MWLKVELGLPLHRLLPQQQNTKESVLEEAGSSVRSTYCDKVPGLAPAVLGGSQPSITLALWDPLISLSVLLCFYDCHDFGFLVHVRSCDPSLSEPGLCHLA